MTNTNETFHDTAEAPTDPATLLERYGDILADYERFSDAAQRFSETPEAIAELNQHIASSSDALYAESRITSTIYQLNTVTGQWEYVSPYEVAGPPRPYIGDVLAVTPDGKLVLGDTARGLGISHFSNLQIRPQADATVEEFSADESVDKLRKLGEIASGTDKIPVITRNRWGQEKTDPDIG
ncbi:MAG: hypothetical protein JWN38_499 [Candidatus Saccharibacteria bacterium]|nr:hypothetical protein [Candidatus Saccharibacteria bacterium]